MGSADVNFLERIGRRVLPIFLPPSLSPPNISSSLSLTLRKKRRTWLRNACRGNNLEKVAEIEDRHDLQIKKKNVKKKKQPERKEEKEEETRHSEWTST
jgi:hypothetical protein